MGPLAVLLHCPLAPLGKYSNAALSKVSGLINKVQICDSFLFARKPEGIIMLTVVNIAL